MATSCRISFPGALILLTHRITRREGLLRPDPVLVLNILYILGYLQSRFDIRIHAVIVLSDHLHIILTDVRGDQVQAFNRELFSLLARSINCYWGRSENLWTTSKPSCVLIAPRREDVVDKSAYLNVNSVEAGLVSHARKWPGVYLPPGDYTKTVRRPGFFYDEDGRMPEEVTLSVTLPEVSDADPEELLRSIQEETNRREQEIRDRFAAQGRKFLGPKRVKRQSPSSAPKSREEWFNLNPHVACKDTGLRIKFLRWRKERQRRYEEKRQALLEGREDVVFPEGTYALHFLYGQAREEWSGCVWARLAAEP